MVPFATDQHFALDKGSREVKLELNMKTAVQSINDLVAVGCAQALLKQGLKIPEDISVVGFGNILLSEYFSVPLTTVRQPKFRLGVAAVETMQQLLQGRRAESKRLPAELLVRASSGIAPATEPLARLNTASIKV